MNVLFEGKVISIEKEIKLLFSILCIAADLQVSGAGYNDKGEIHIHKCDSVDKARESIYRLLEVSSFNTEINYF